VLPSLVPMHGAVNLGNLQLYGNVLDYVPNVAQLPRNVIVSETNVDAGFMYSSIYNVGRDPYMLLDVTVSNGSGSTAIVSIDNRQYWILDGFIRTIGNIPANQFKIETTGATANSIDLTFFGTTIEYLNNLATGSKGGALNLGDWFQN
jgi:hypothetical protein